MPKQSANINNNNFNDESKNEEKYIEVINGVYILSLDVFLSFTIPLRQKLIELYYLQNSMQGKKEKIDLIYEYLTGETFKRRFQHIIETFEILKDELEREKRSYKKIWAEREKRLELVLDSAASAYGEIRAIAGREILAIDYLDDADEPLRVSSTSEINSPDKKL